MVKGITQQVVIVRAPDSELFDEAIFLIRPGAAEKQAMTDQMLLEEAKKAAAPGLTQRRAWLRQIAAALCGAGATGLVWLLSLLF